MSDPVTYPVTQNPANTVAIGFLGAKITGFIRENENFEPSADTEYIQDEDANDAVAIVSNRGKRFTVDGVVKHGTTLPRKGDAVTVDSVVYFVEAASARSTSKARRFSLTLYKPDATTFTATSNS